MSRNSCIAKKIAVAKKARFPTPRTRRARLASCTSRYSQISEVFATIRYTKLGFKNSMCDAPPGQYLSSTPYTRSHPLVAPSQLGVSARWQLPASPASLGNEDRRSDVSRGHHPLLLLIPPDICHLLLPHLLSISTAL